MLNIYIYTRRQVYTHMYIYVYTHVCVYIYMSYVIIKASFPVEYSSRLSSFCRRESDHPVLFLRHLKPQFKKKKKNLSSFCK